MDQIDYLLGDSTPETARLASQHRAWLEITLRSWRRAGLKAGHRVLDLGAGPGLATRELSYEVGADGRVLALDQSPAFIAELRDLANRAGNIDVVQSTIEGMELDEESLDLAYARWVFCFLKRPDDAIARLARAIKPGGTLVALDYFNYSAFTLAPRSEAMRKVVEAVGASWRQHDGSLDIAGELPTMMQRHGLRVESIEHASPLVRPGDTLWRWPKMFLEAYIPELVNSQLLDQDAADAFWSDWHKREATAGSFLYLPPVIEIVARKPNA